MSVRRRLGRACRVAAAAACAAFSPRTDAAGTDLWKLNHAGIVAGHPTQVLGAPVETGDALEFDGHHDGVIVPVNPLAGLSKFTVQMLIRPASDGGAEQRFFHAEDRSGLRALLELRLDKHGRWWLDTFLGSATPGAGLVLVDPSRTHPSGRDHWVALTYDGQTMAGYVNGVRETQGTIKWGPMAEGRVSLGVRLNRVSWYKGTLQQVQISPVVVPPDALNRVRE